MASTPPLIVIIGQTATGKSELAIQLAERFDGEIISADSRTVYRGMDIGTAKPTPADRARIPHHGLDLVNPDQLFSVADFKAYAQRTIDEITGRSHVPIMAGGSGLYVDAVLYDYQFAAPADPALRKILNGLSVMQLQDRIAAAGLMLPIDPLNPRRLIRVIEGGGTNTTRSQLRANTLILGLQVEHDVLRERIAHRACQMLSAGLEAEIRLLAETYGWDVSAMQAPGYQTFRDNLIESSTSANAKERLIRDHVALAKRQLTWFQRNKSIHWLMTDDKLAEAVDIATTFLSK